LERLADRLPADRAHHVQPHQPIGQQRERPPLAAVGGGRAGEGDEPGLGPPVELSLPARSGLRLAGQGGVQPVLDEPLADPPDGIRADLDRVGDPVVGPPRPAVGLVGLEQDAGMGQLLGGRLAGGDQGGPVVPLVGGQSDAVLLHGGLLPVHPSHPTPDHTARQHGRSTSITPLRDLAGASPAGKMSSWTPGS